MTPPPERERPVPSARARRWATIAASLGVLVMLALGSWQVQRLIWKNNEQAYRDARVSAEPIELPLHVEAPADLHYRRVWVEGVFDHDKEMFLAARSHERQVGYQVITPFERTGGDTILINRGWVPLDRKAPESRAAGQVRGTVRVEGLLVPGGRPSWFAPDNHPEQRLWYWVDLETMSAAAGIPAQAFIIDAGPAENPGGYPIGGQTVVTLRNEHLSYVIIWYALAVGLAVIYLLYMRRGRRRAPRATPP
ncbi:MAG: SURF1 family protein [Alphaproteobacteria bacterium]